jgi:Fe-coproporphyrin III synthase
MQSQGIIHTLKRYRTLRSHRISVLPIAILMPHSACNCRCVMCDIWKGNKNSKQLEIKDIEGILTSLKKLDTRRVVMSGGEALLNPNFFRFCEMMHDQNIKVTLLSTGLTLKRNAESIVKHVDEVILSLDGDEELHDRIRNVKGAFAAMKDGILAIKQLDPYFPVSARCVIHNYNFKRWDKIIIAAKSIGFDRVSFLPADVSTTAFNREQVWDVSRQEDILIKKEDLPMLQDMINTLYHGFNSMFESGFIAESKQKIQKIHQYYSAHHKLTSFPEKKCNAPWVSAVVEADGSVRPCFFHDTLGSIKENSLEEILNNSNAHSYRKNLDTQKNTTCVKCVCYLNLAPRNKHY